MVPNPSARAWALAALALALALAPVGVASASPTAADLRATAEALEAEGRDSDAAAMWERLAKEATAQDRLRGYIHAVDARKAALERTGDDADRDAMRSLLMRAIEDPQLEDRAREEFRAELAQIEHAGPRVDLLSPEGDLPSPRRRTSPPIVDRPRRSPLTIGGGVTLALAAPALGGFIYAAAADRAIAREAEAQREKLKAGGVVDQTAVDERRPEAILLRDLQIGLGVTTAVLAATGVGLILAGHRARKADSVVLLPHARAGFGGIILTGRF